MLFACYCMAVEHAETNLRTGFAKLLLKRLKTSGEKQTGVTPGWPGTTLGKRQCCTIECITRVKCCYLRLSQPIV